MLKGGGLFTNIAHVKLGTLFKYWCVWSFGMDLSHFREKTLTFQVESSQSHVFTTSFCGNKQVKVKSEQITGVKSVISSKQSLCGQWGSPGFGVSCRGQCALCVSLTASASLQQQQAQNSEGWGGLLNIVRVPQRGQGMNYYTQAGRGNVGEKKKVERGREAKRRNFVVFSSLVSFSVIEAA